MLERSIVIGGVSVCGLLDRVAQGLQVCDIKVT